ncbi:MAG: hypothetical protein J6S85_26475 [Methanobrevibacter sp.]|nr:hypothetical protein [Methanobrevibacter sp.]MBO7717140.1 hypothetical protein [Methanobrevibacter sp.]
MAWIWATKLNNSVCAYADFEPNPNTIPSYITSGLVGGATPLTTSSFGQGSDLKWFMPDTGYLQADCWRPGNWVTEFNALFNSGMQGQFQTYTDQIYFIDVGIAVDESQSQAYPIYFYKYRNDDKIYINTLYFTQTSAKLEMFYNWVKDWLEVVPPIIYNWQSVPSISGKNGILSLSRVLDDSLLTGDSIARIELSDMSESIPARFAVLQQNLPNGVPIPVIYAGLVDNLTITMKHDGYSNLYDFNLNVNTIYSIEGNLSANSLGFIIDNDNEVAKVVYYTAVREAGIVTYFSMTVPTQSETEMHNLWLWLFTHMDPEDDPKNNEEDEGTPEEYQPDIAVTGITKPLYGAIDTGFTSMYRMSKTQLQNLSNFLWSDNFVDVVKKFFNDPREIIVGLTLMPVTPTTGSSKEVKAGGISTGVYGLPLTDQYVKDTYGYAEVKAEKGNFLDYEPYTKVTAHLPFVGEHSLSPSDVVGKQLSLIYIFDFLTGSCVAEIDVDGKPRYFFGGSCGIQIPTSSEDFGRMYSSILSAGATVGSTLATIATGGLAAPLMIGAASSMLANGMNSSPTVQFSSGSGSVNGMIGCKSAFLVIEKPKEKVAADQQKFVGKPSFITKKLSSCSGYTKCLSVHLDNIAATEGEREEIEAALLNGVIIASGSETPSYTPTSASDNGLIFLKCKSDKNVIGKTWDSGTGDINTIEGKILFNKSLLNPTFLIEGDVSAYNYCYIPLFKRFYYIMGITAKSGNMEEVEMKVDVLQSWKGDSDVGILSNKAVIERQQSLNNAYFSDNMYWTQANKEVKTVPFTKSDGAALVFDIPADNYILTIAGG